jgi:hypothetical protein
MAPVICATTDCKRRIANLDGRFDGAASRTTFQFGIVGEKKLFDEIAPSVRNSLAAAKRSVDRPR